MDADRETERTAVKTYVPKYQKEEWEGHADRLDMSHSEFVRTMVQAGRRGFDIEDPGRGGTSPRGNTLETRLQEILRRSDHLSWDELVEALSEDVEARLDGALDELQDRNRVRYSGREGGYTLVDDGDQ